MLLLIIALLFIVSGIFVMDPTGTPLNQATVHGIIHGLGRRDHFHPDAHQLFCFSAPI